MELENAIKIDLDQVELLAIKEPIYIDWRNESKFKINWCRLKEKPNELICLSEGFDKLSEEIKEKEIPIVNINEIVKERLNVIVEKELNSFIGRNINNISYFFEKEEHTNAYRQKYYTNPQFLKISDIGDNLLEGEKSINNRIRAFTGFCNYDEINNAKIKYKKGMYEDVWLEVDLKDEKIITDPSEILLEIYSNDDLKKILAYKQYELGITPNFYNEITKINKFLKDKKTITVVLENDIEIKVEANITNIIDFYNGKFLLNRNELGISDEICDEKKLDINSLKTLRHGKSELNIDTQNLIPLEMQLDEIINKNDKGIICNIKEEEKELENE